MSKNNEKNILEIITMNLKLRWLSWRGGKTIKLQIVYLSKKCKVSVFITINSHLGCALIRKIDHKSSKLLSSFLQNSFFILDGFSEI